MRRRPTRKLSRAAHGVAEPVVRSRSAGVALATIATYGDVVPHVLTLWDYEGATCPLRRSDSPTAVPYGSPLALDHGVRPCRARPYEQWGTSSTRRVFVETVCIHFSDRTLDRLSSLMSKVMDGRQGKVKFPSTAAEGKAQEPYRRVPRVQATGPGAQHIAMQSPTLVDTRRGAPAGARLLLTTPDAYD